MILFYPISKDFLTTIKIYFWFSITGWRLHRNGRWKTQQNIHLHSSWKSNLSTNIFFQISGRIKPEIHLGVFKLAHAPTQSRTIFHGTGEQMRQVQTRHQRTLWTNKILLDHQILGDELWLELSKISLCRRPQQRASLGNRSELEWWFKRNFPSVAFRFAVGKGQFQGVSLVEGRLRAVQKFCRKTAAVFWFYGSVGRALLGFGSGAATEELQVPKNFYW